jgi:hypothetical protein
MVVFNLVFYSMVVLLVVKELTAAITDSHVWFPIDFGAILGNFSQRRKMDDCFSVWRKRKSSIFCCDLPLVLMRVLREAG